MSDVSISMTPHRTALKNEIADNIEFGEALLTMLNRKAESQLEVVAPAQNEDLLALWRSLLEYTGRPGKAQSGAMAAIRMPTMRLPTQGREIHAKDHND